MSDATRPPGDTPPPPDVAPTPGAGAGSAPARPEGATPPPGGPDAGEQPTAQVLAREADYARAQRVVDDLSDRGFPVEHLAIVGHGLTTVEHVTGRLTKGRAALQGAAGGAWFGLLVGLLIGLFVPAAAWLGLVVWGALFGAAFGAVFGFAAHWSTRGRRDFSSVQTLAAREYHVVVDPGHAAEARRYLEAGRT